MYDFLLKENRDIEIALARIDFYSYCILLEPDFYSENKPHLKILCDTLNDFHYGKLIKEDGEPYEKLMIRLPPQHGKSRTLVNFTKWTLGRNNEERIITGSFGDTAASDFSRFTRDGINEIKNTPEQITHSDIFPECKIKRGNATVQKWALEGQHFNYLGVGVGGAVTGKGATLRIIDDLVKDAKTAMNPPALRNLWVWLTGTFSSRNAAEGGVVKEIFCATLWNENDPQSLLEKHEPNEWFIISMPIYDETNDKMLCDSLMNKSSFLKLKDRMLINPISKAIFFANYLCQKVAVEGMLYSTFKTYSELPFTPKFVESFTDVADEGKDYLCTVAYAKYQGFVYVLDVLYTQDAAEKTEVQNANLIIRNNVIVARFESNNGGKSYARNVEKISRSLGNFKTAFKWLFQSQNKVSRIMVNSGIVTNIIVMPENWADKFPDFYSDVVNYTPTATNLPDDAPDVLTKIVELSTQENVNPML